MNPGELQTIALLRTLDERTLTRLASVVESRSFADGEPIFREGDLGEGMYFIASGRVQIEKQTGGGAAERKVLSILEAGDYFGEMALFDRQPRSATAVAAGTTKTLWLSTEAFTALHGGADHAGLEVMFAMIRTASERIRRLNAQVVVYDEIGRAIGEAKSLNDLLKTVLEQLCQATLAAWGMILLRQEFSGRVEVRTTVNLALTAEQKEALAGGGGFVTRALGETEGRLVPNPETDAWLRAQPRLGFETTGLLLMPVLAEGQALGLVVLGAGADHALDLNDLNLARGVARQAGQAILNARHREEDQARVRHGRQFVRF